MKSISTSRQADAFINSFINLERGQDPFTKRTYRLDRMEFLLELFGNPHHSFQSLHIAGSKGKGSTAVMAASVLEAAGHTVGLFISPHLLTVRERFRVNRKPITQPLYFELLTEIQRTLAPLPADRFPGDIQPTFFEIMTLVGFLAFRRHQCRYVVLEVGLGGRLDATNVVTPLASLLTSMELEHEDILGDTLEKITKEKCGIIKPAVPVFSSAQAPAARKVIETMAREMGAPLEFVPDTVAITRGRATLHAAEVGLRLIGSSAETPATGDRFSLSLVGEVQAENAALVYLTLSRLFPGLERRHLRRGLNRASLPGRMEVVRDSPPLILDGAHTPGSIERLVPTINALLPGPRVLLFATVLGKKYRDMAVLLAPLFDWIIVSTPGTFKKSNPAEVFAVFQTLHPRVMLRESSTEALREAETCAAGVHPILVTGSFYFVAEIKKLLRRKNRPSSSIANRRLRKNSRP
jgi:dihydrofolate synthase/folylpolyglutamate synthase